MLGHETASTTQIYAQSYVESGGENYTLLFWRRGMALPQLLGNLANQMMKQATKSLE
jgi:hypothetical protein